MNALRLAWRFLRRDLAAGEVRVLLAALVLAVTAVTSVSFLTDRAERALGMEANRLLGGDAVLRGDLPIGDGPRRSADSSGIVSTETVSFPSMVRAGEALKLSDIRALGDGYPLRGSFLLAAGEDGAQREADGIPPPGTVWLSRAGAVALGAAEGDVLKVGNLELQVVGRVTREPDAALDYFNVAPRVFMNLADLDATGLVQEGSRVTWRLVVAGDAGAVEGWVAATRAGLDRGQRLETIADARPEIRSALNRADRFLGLAALVSVVLSAIAVAMAARRHSARHLDGCAVLRCLGADQRTISIIHVGELLLLGLGGSLVGIALAALLQAIIGNLLGEMLGIAIPGAGWLPALEGMAVGLTVLLAFAVPPVLALRKVPALRVLRRDLGQVEPSAVLVAAVGITGLAALLWWKAGSATLGAWMLGGIIATLAVLALLAWLLILLVRKLRGRLRGPWRYGLANVGRRAAVSVAQVSALGLGLMMILLLTLVRTDLLDRWQQMLPEDAPNRFIVGVQNDQVEGVEALLNEQQVVDPVLYPMIRGRLVEVNGQPVSGSDYEDRGGRARRLAEREFNLSFADGVREGDNEIVAGQIWNGRPDTPQVSVEEGIAEALGWSLGDSIAFDIADQRFEASITSLRRVDWESFQPNFFVLASPGALDGYAGSYITAVRVPFNDVAVTRALVERYPNVSVIDIDAVIDQVRSTAEQVTVAVEYVFYFTLAAGLLVLVAAVSASQDERLLEGGVMRVLGASRRQLRLAQATEFASIGLLAGVIAAFAANLLTGVVAIEVFGLSWRPAWGIAAIGALAGMLAVLVTGLIATRRVVQAPPSTTLRALQA